MHLAVDGWELAKSPGGVLAWRACELAERLTALDPALRLSWLGPTPLATDLPIGEVKAVDGGRGPWARLAYEQRRLPAAAERLGADLLLGLEGSAPLRAGLPVVIEQTAWPASPGGVAERLRRAAAAAGALGAAGRYRWQDLASVDLGPPAETLLAPFVGPGFRPTAAGDDRSIRQRHGLIDGYVLALEPDRTDLELLLSAWTWVEASVGDAHPLVIAGLDAQLAGHAGHWSEALDLVDSLRLVPTPAWDELPALLRGAAAVIHPGPSANGQELRWAMACGIPIAGVDSAVAAAVVGQAGYLVAEADSRALGAACLTLLVEQREVGQDLRQKGLLRAMAFHDEAAPSAYLAYLRQVGKT